MCLCRFAAERDDDLAMESSFAQQQFEEQRRFVQGVHHSSQTSPTFRCKTGVGGGLKMRYVQCSIFVRLEEALILYGSMMVQ